MYQSLDGLQVLSFFVFCNILCQMKENVPFRAGQPGFRYCSAPFVCILLFLRGYSVKPALVWNDDGHFLLLCPGTYFHEKADRSGTQQTVLSYRGSLVY